MRAGGEPVQEPGRTKRTGGVRRKEDNSLPRVVLVFERASKSVLGAMFLTECALNPDDEAQVDWRGARFVELAEPLKVERMMQRYNSIVFELTTGAERKARQEVECRAGGEAQSPLRRFHRSHLALLCV